MQFFSRKKALLTVGLAALGGLAACGDDVTVPVTPASVVISITPPNASMNIGDVQTFSVQVTGGSAATPPTLASCATSNANVVSVAKAAAPASACTVTAVGAGSATITAVSTGGQQASAGVTVTALTQAISAFTVSPTAANAAPGTVTTITPSVTKANSNNTVVYTYISNNTAIATVGTVGTNGSVNITAVAPGVATITATAVGSGTGYSSATLNAATTITVGSFPSGITTLTVQPTSLAMAVGRTAGLTAASTQPTGAPAITYTFASSNQAVATVSGNATTGAATVTAIAPGTASITVTASSAASAAGSNPLFAASTLSQVIPVVVQPLANVSIQAINQGPYITTGLDSAYNASSYASGNPLFVNGSISNGSGPVGASQGVIAGIRKSPNGQVGQPIDVTNTKDQIQVILNLQPNGQRVDSVVVYIDSGSTNTTVRRAAARQLFSNGDAGNQQTVSITTFILTEDFTTNEATGVGEVAFVNGLKRISASVWTTLSTGQTCVSGGTAAPNNTTPCELQNAANVRQNVNFNNIDGFALKMGNSVNANPAPANSATDAQGRTWWGGPTVINTTAPVVPGEVRGDGRFQTYPVIYTPGRAIQAVSATFGRCLGFGVDGIPNSVTIQAPTTAGLVPFIFTYGSGAPADAPATSKFIDCAGKVGAYDVGDQFRFEDYPMVVASLDNSNNPGPRVLYAYNPAQGPDAFAGPRPTLFRASPQLVNPNAIRIDYQAPQLGLSVTYPNNERFVNDAYSFNSNYTASDMWEWPATSVYPGAGVGLLTARNTVFSVASASSPACAGTTTAQQAFTVVPGGLGATIAGVFSITPNTNRESPCDFTNNAFVAHVEETDRLGNTGKYGSLPSAGSNGFPLFGIDNTAPTVTPSYDGTGPIADTPNYYAATGDSIFQPVNTATGVAATPTAIGAANATDFYFGVRYRDERSGFNINDHGTRTVKRWAPAASPILSDVASVTTVASRTLNFLGGTGNPVENEDPTFRRDSVTIYGGGPIANTNTANPLLASPPVGYYLYTFTITDRAMNSATPVVEHAVIDQTSPIITGTTIPPLFGVNDGGTAIAQQFNPTGTDDVEAIDFDLFLRYPAMALVGDSSAGSVVINNGARMRFRRDKFANPHNAWQVFTDGLLNTPFGPTAALSTNQVTMPIASIRGLEPVDSTDAPIAYGSGAVNPFTGFKPNAVGVYAFDVRATHKGTTFLAPYVGAGNLPFLNLGMTNLFPSVATPPAGEAGYTENLFVGNIANGTRWDTKDLNTGTTGQDRLVSWAGFSNSGSVIEFRATTSTVVTQPPFPMVHLFRWEANAQLTGATGATQANTTLGDSAQGQWVYIGTVTANAPSNPIINDQGATRFWRYQFTAAAFGPVTNGSIVQSGVTTGCYRAVGVDVVGDGITTNSFGGPANCPSTVGTLANQLTIVAGAVAPTLTLRGYGNGTGQIQATTGAAFTLTKSATNGVERISQNRAAATETFNIIPTNSATVDRTPMGCTVVGVVVFPTAAPFQCTVSHAMASTITVIFENPGAGAP